MIIGILAAVIIPNFFTAKIKTFDGAAKSDLRNMIVAQENYFSSAQAYTDVAVPAGGQGDLNGDGTEDFRASSGVAVGAAAYTDGFQITSEHTSSPNSWCVNTSGSATAAPGQITLATGC